MRNIYEYMQWQIAVDSTFDFYFQIKTKFSLKNVYNNLKTFIILLRKKAHNSWNFFFLFSNLSSNTQKNLSDKKEYFLVLENSFGQNACSSIVIM